MSIEYWLTLGGDIPLEDVAKLAAPDATESTTPSGERMLSADLNEECGYVVDIITGSQGYYEAENDGGTLWHWEPETYVEVSFYMRKDALAAKGKPNMLRAVARVLAGSTEDASLTLNGDWLMLTRFGGKLHKHNMDGWYNKEYDTIFPQ